MPIDLKGIFPPLPTPFENGHTAPQRLRENIEKLAGAGLAGYLVLGSNGEAPYLSEAEKIEVIRAARSAISKNKLMLVGTGLEATALTTVFTIRAADLGADAALVLPPFFYPEQMNADALRRHFETIANASPIPILLYNVPKFTHLNIPVDTVLRLAKHENIIGIKDSSGNLGQLAVLQEHASPNFHVMFGTDGVLLGGLVHGLQGGILALANVAPRECVEMLRAVEQEEIFVARELMQRIAPVGRAATARFGVPGLKAMLDLLGFYGGDPRPPLLPVSPAVREELRVILQEAGLMA
jgi:4-hydroxy-2-oxoglutarate aldolase